MRKIIPGNLVRIIRDVGAPHDAPRDLGSVDLELPQKKKRRWACMTKPKQHLPMHSQVYRCTESRCSWFLELDLNLPNPSEAQAEVYPENTITFA